MKWRFLLFVLLAAAVPLALAVVGTGDASLSAAERLEERLTGALASLESRLDAEAARRRELLLRLAVLDGLTQPVRDAAKDGLVPPADAVVRVREATRDLFNRDPPELIGLVTAGGAQIVVTTNEPRTVPAAQLPLAGAAIRDGAQAETLALFDGGLFQFFAAPVGVAEGAIVLGFRIGDATANRLRDASKAENVTFVAGGVPLVSSFPEPLRSEVAGAAAKANTTHSLGRLGTGLPGLSFLDDWFPLLAPGARWLSLAHDVGGGVSAVVTISAERQIGWLGRMQVVAIALSLGTLLLGLVWLALVYGPVARQARTLEAHLARLRAERGARLGTKGFTKPFDSMARELDRLADEWVASAPAPGRDAESTPRPDAKAEPVRPLQRPLDLPLATAPSAPEPAEGTPSAFPFGDVPRAATPEPLEKTPVPFELPRTPKPMELAKEAPKSKDLPRAQPVELPGPVAAGARWPATPESLDPPFVAKAAPIAEVREPTGPVPLPAPPPARGATSAKDPFAAFGPAPDPELADRTREAVIPPELLARSRELEQELLAPPVDPDEDHFRLVFEEFVSTRRKCGEPPDAALTLDKFTARLKKNREQLVQKYSCRSVRFQVYVKEGKAAVKAAPVR